MPRKSVRVATRLLLVTALAVTALLAAASGGRVSVAAPSPLNQRVLVVYNQNVPDSLDVANYYVARRQIPAQNKCAIDPPATGYVNWSVFDSTVRTPIRNCLNAVGRGQILYIVFAYQTPFEIDQVPTGDGPALRSLDQFIADIWNEYAPDNDAYPREHPYYAAAQSQGGVYQPFVSLADYRSQTTAKMIYSVWRLDAANVNLAKGLVDKALLAEADGLAGQGCFDRNRGSINWQPDWSYSAGEWDLKRAADFARQAGFAVTEDENAEEFGTPPAPPRCDNAALYSGWYSYNHYNDAFTWSTGAVGFHLDSASALDPREGTNWSANALIRGITVTSGSVTEPYLEGLAHADGVFRNLFEGANVGDAFLRNTAYLKWVIINIGDPLYRPFPEGLPPFNSPSYRESTLSLDRDFVGGGGSAVGTVSLANPAPAGGAVVSLTTSAPDVTSVPLSVTIPAGATSATFTVTTSAVISYRPAVITATYTGGAVANTLIVAPLLSSISLSPPSIIGGATSTCTVWLNDEAPAGGVEVVLTSGNPAVATVPHSVLIPEGEAAASFTVTTNQVAVNTSVVISASFNGVMESATLLVLPGVAPTPTPTPPPPPPPGGTAATFVRLDATTQGNWKGAYGADGREVVNDSASYPAYAQVTTADAIPYTWAASTPEVRALQKAAPADRIAATWYSWGSFTLDLNLTDGQQHEVALYCLDWERAGRTQTVEVLDAATGALLDSRSVADFGEGKYVVWNLRGHVKVRVTKMGAANAVLSGLFFGPASGVTPTPTPAPGGAAATYVKTDDTTQGSWKGAYGADGHEVVNDSAIYPPYAQVSLSDAAPYTWADSTAEARALQRAGSGRIAATWYSWGSFTLDLNLTDGQWHEVSLYCLDWERVGRSQIIEVVDAATGAVLDSRSVADFGEGKYVVWNLRGRVQVRVAKTGAANAVVSGLFFGPRQ